MKTREDAWEIEPGRKLHRYVFEPESAAGGGVIMLHGLGDYLGRYAHVAERFTRHGWLCLGVDLPGHGRSPGQRGHIPGGVASIGRILDRCVTEVRSRLPDCGLPLGLFAHSMGGFLALGYLAGRNGDFQMAWISSPLIRPDLTQHPWLVHVGRVAARLVPRFPIDTGVRTAECRHPDSLTGKLVEDPLLHHHVTAAFGMDLVDYASKVAASARGLGGGLHLLMTHGMEDHVCPPKLSREVFDSMPLRFKTYLPVEDSLHEPLHDDRAGWVLEKAGEWLRATGLIQS